MITVPTRGWQARAACGGTPTPDDFFPGQYSRTAKLGPAKALCAGCPVRAECLEWALDHPEDTQCGIWAGYSRNGLRALRKARKAGAS